MRPRDNHDGLPYRTYERHGSRTYSIGYKKRDGKWEFRLRCPVDDLLRIRECRRDAIARAAVLNSREVDKELTFADLCDLWIKHQRDLFPSMKEKRAASTMAENRNEIATLCKAFGPMRISDITTADGNDYMDACLKAKDAEGRPRPRAAKGWKELVLARVIFNFAVRQHHLVSNPFDKVQKQEIAPPEQRHVEKYELALAVKVGKKMGGPYHIMALCLKTAYLCFRRSVEARNLRRDMIKADGIHWTIAKRRQYETEKKVIIEWTRQLRATIDEALRCRGETNAGNFYVFGNQAGSPYTKGGWKANLARLMAQCEKVAEKRKKPFRKFSLQDCRPMAVSDYLEKTKGDLKGAVQATGHTTQRTIGRYYDRRKVLKAKPMHLDENSKFGMPDEERG